QFADRHLREGICRLKGRNAPLVKPGRLLYHDRLLMRGGAVWQLVGLITRRSQVRILPPLPNFKRADFSVEKFLPSGNSPDRVGLVASALQAEGRRFEPCPATNYFGSIGKGPGGAFFICNPRQV